VSDKDTGPSAFTRLVTWVGLLGLFAVAVLVVWGALAHVRVTVRNSGGAQLQDVRVAVSGVSQALGSLAPNEEKSCRVRAKGESGVTITYLTAGGRKIDSGAIGYLEPGNAGSITFTIDDRGVQGEEWRVWMYL
jgi:hypothetical protein